MFRLSTTGFETMISELEQAMEWLAGLSISTTRSRFAEYLRTLKRIDRRWREGATRADEIPVDPILMETAALEAWQLVRTWRGLRDQPPAGLARKLALMVDGPVLEINERSTNSGNSARDSGFELDVAAFFSNAGAVDLTRDVDVTLNARGIPHFIECKRPSSQKRLSKNLNEASSQIMVELGRSRLACYGIAAISAAKAHFRGWPLIRGRTIEEIRAAIRSWMKRFDDSFLAPWFARQRDGRVVAVLVHFPYIAYTGDSPTILGNEYYLIARKFIRGTRAHSDLEGLTRSLELSSWSD